MRLDLITLHNLDWIPIQEPFLRLELLGIRLDLRVDLLEVVNEFCILRLGGFHRVTRPLRGVMPRVLLDMHACFLVFSSMGFKDEFDLGVECRVLDVNWLMLAIQELHLSAGTLDWDEFRIRAVFDLFKG